MSKNAKELVIALLFGDGFPLIDLSGSIDSHVSTQASLQYQLKMLAQIAKTEKSSYWLISRLRDDRYELSVPSAEDSAKGLDRVVEDFSQISPIMVTRDYHQIPVVVITDGFINDGFGRHARMGNSRDSFWGAEGYGFYPTIEGKSKKKEKPDFRSDKRKKRRDWE